MIQIAELDNGEQTILKVIGRIDCNSVKSAVKFQKRFLKQNKTQLAFDLTSVDYLDSYGLSFLVSCHNEILRRNGEMRVLNPQNQVLALIELTRLDRILNIQFTTDQVA